LKDNPSQVLPPGPVVKIDLGFEDDSLDQMTKLYHQFGEIFKVYSPFRKSYTYVLNNPEHIKHVMVNNNRNYVKGVGMDRVKILLGNGIIVSDGDYWKRQRRMIQPSFKKKNISDLVSIMQHLNRAPLENWLQQADQKKASEHHRRNE